MAASSSWFGWLTGLFSVPPLPGTHEALLEQYRVSALVEKEHRKPPGQRDEELLRTLLVKFRKLQLQNAKADVRLMARYASGIEQSGARDCCTAAGWVRQRVLESYRALDDYWCQHIQQVMEELAAAEARRPAVLVAQPTLHLHLTGALQQPPPRLDMCSVCAGNIQKAPVTAASRMLTWQISNMQCLTLPEAENRALDLVSKDPGDAPPTTEYVALLRAMPANGSYADLEAVPTTAA